MHGDRRTGPLAPETASVIDGSQAAVLFSPAVDGNRAEPVKCVSPFASSGMLDPCLGMLGTATRVVDKRGLADQGEDRRDTSDRQERKPTRWNDK